MMRGEGAGTRTRPMTRRPELAAWRPAPEPTTELTVWERRGWMAETTWLTTSSLELEEEVVVVVVAGLRLLEEDPEMAEPTAELTRGWIWETTEDTMESEFREEDCWLLELDPKLEDPNAELEPNPELEDPNPELEEPNPELEEPEKEDPDELADPEPLIPLFFSLIWTKFSLTSLVSV